MGATADVRDSYGEAWRLIAPFLATHLAVRLIAAALVVPLAGVILGIALARAGRDAVTDQDIALFLATPGGFVAGLALVSLLVVAAVLDVAVMTATIRSGRHRAMTALRGGVAFLLPRLPGLLIFAALFVLRVLLIAAPFLIAAGAVALWLLTEFDINYYLTERPPAFWLAAGLIGGIAAALAAVLLRRLLGWAVALHLHLFAGLRPGRSFGESAAAMAGRRGELTARLALWLALRLVLGGIVAALFGTAVIGLPGALGPSLSLIAGVLVAVLLIWMLADALVSAWSNGALASLLNEVFDTAAGHRVIRDVDAPGAPARGLTAGPVLLAVGVCTALGLVLGGLLVDRVSAQQDVAVIAHRGAAGDRPENTLAAVEKAIEDRADWIEIDVQEIADGTVVVAHDSDFMKQAGNPLKIWDATPADLAEIDIGSWFDPAYADARVPTLAQVLETVRERSKLLIELKYYGHDEDLEARVAALVDAAGMADSVAVMSLDHAGVEKMRALRPGWRMGVLAARALGDLTRLDAEFMAVETGQATARLIAAARAADQDLYVWTVDDPLTMSRMISVGVDGLITNEPALARQVIDARAAMTTPERLMLWVADTFGLGVERLASAVDDAG